MPPLTTTGDISYRTAGYMAKELLKRAQPLLIIQQFGQPKPLPKNSTRVMKFRGYEHLPNQPKALQEGITPQASKPTFRDVEATIGQYGDYIHLTDVLADTHEDPLISEFSDILGEQAAIMMAILPNLPVSALVVNNFFRDQLDRAREMEQLIESIENVLPGYDQTLILNGNDPNVVRLSLKAPRAHIVYFGLAKNEASVTSTREASEGKFCPRCGHRLQYAYYQYSHIGSFSCPH